MNDAARITALEPTRDPRSSLTDLLQVILDRGVVLHLDLIVAVADIPLIGLNVRAALAGIETMLAYGMMRDWDASTRAWVQRSLSRQVPLGSGEVVEIAGSVQVRRGRGSRWRPGTLYLTDRRVLVHRREPAELLLDVTRTRIARATVRSDVGIGGGARDLVALETDAGDCWDLLTRHSAPLAAALGATRAPGGEDGPPLVYEATSWYHEETACDSVWRGGRLCLREGRLTWTGTLERRAAVQLEVRDVVAVRAIETSSLGPGIEIVTRSGDALSFVTSAPHDLVAALGRAVSELVARTTTR